MSKNLSTIRNRLPRVALVTLATLASSCCLAVDVETLDRPGGKVRVVDAGRRPVPSATVVLARFEVEPHFAPTPQASWIAVTDETGTAAFTHGTTTQTQYPLFPHGVGANAWHVCVEHPGHRSVLAGWMIQAPPEGLSWTEYLHTGPDIDALEITLEPGESTPCLTALGRQEPAPREQLTLGAPPAAPPPAPPPTTLRLTGSTVGCDVWGGDGDGVPLIRHATLDGELRNFTGEAIHIDRATWRLEGTSVTGAATVRPADVPAQSTATVGGQARVDAKALEALDEGMDHARLRQERTLRVDVTWAVAGSNKLKTTTLTQEVRWRSCFEVPSPTPAAATPMPDVSDAPAALRGLDAACRGGSAPACTRLGDHYFSHVAGPRGRALYVRAADLDWAVTPVVPSTPGRPIITQADAIARLRAAWPSLVARMSTNNKDWAAAHSSALMRAAIGDRHTQISARRVPCQDGHRWVHQLEHEHGGARRLAVLVGTSSEVRRDGACWAVMFHGGMKGEVLAHVGADDGRILTVTRVPEG